MLNMKISMNANVHTNLTMNVKKSAKMKLNTMLKTGMKCCRAVGHSGAKSKPRGREGIVQSAWVPIVPLWGTPRGGCDRAHV
jgi:hypothetical protein